jgi:hypothetical protein
MISRKQALALLFLSLLSFAPYFIHPYFVDADPYYFLNQICKENYTTYRYNENILANYFFDVVPCNFLILKSLLFVGFFLSVLSISFLGSLFHKKYGWMAGIFSFLSPLLAREFLKLENDQFGYVFLFWSLYFFYKAKLQKSKINYLYSFILILIGIGFWSGGLFFLIAFALNSWVFLIPGILTYFFFGTKLYQSIHTSIDLLLNLGQSIGSRIVLEQQPLIAIVYWFGLALGSTFIALPFLPQLIFFIILGIISVKFAVLAVPFLCLSMLCFYTKLLRKKKFKIARAILVSSVGLALAWGLLIPFNVPTDDQWNAIDYTIQSSKDLNATLVNHWDLGYWVQWKDANASAWGSTHDIDYNSLSNSVIITHEDVSCKKLEEFKSHKIYYCK